MKPVTGEGGGLPDLAHVAHVVFDFDGVFTDNTVIVNEDGTESVRCWRSDGLGLAKLRAVGVGLHVLSTEANPVVLRRCEKLRIDVVAGCEDKGAELLRVLDRMGADVARTAYVGNDINDAPCLRAVGVPIVVADAHPDVVSLALLRTETRGGLGAVREVCDEIARAHGWSVERAGEPV